MRKLLFSVLMFFSLASFADTYPVKVEYYVGSFGSGTRFPSYDAACSYAKTAYSGASYTVTGTNPVLCKVYDSGGVLLQTLTLAQFNSCPYGGSQDGLGNCVNAPPCSSGGIRDSLTGECKVPPPPTCTAGDTKMLYVLSGHTGIGAASYTINLAKDITGAVTAPPIEYNGGCVYTTARTTNDNKGCTVNSLGQIYCSVMATATGSQTAQADTALPIETLTPMPQDQCKAPLLWDGQGCTVPAPHKNCFTVQNGEEICAPELKPNCGQVNGVDVCMNNNALTSGGNPAAIVDGHVVVDTPNENGQVVNCALSKNAGKPVCIGLPTGDLGHVITNLKTAPTADNPTPRVVPVTTNVEEVSKTNTVTNADNSKTVTTTTTTNVFNSSPTIVTQTINAAGQVTGTTTQKGDPDGSGNTKGTGTALNSTYSGKGRFYTTTGDTVQSVSNTFMEATKNSPIMKAGKDVFDVTFPQMSACSSCDFGIPAVMGMASVESRPFCADWMPAMWLLISSALHIATIFLAVRWIVGANS